MNTLVSTFRFNSLLTACQFKRYSRKIVELVLKNMTTAVPEGFKPSTETEGIKLSSCREESQRSSTPQFIIDKSAYTVVKEGKAEVLFPNSHDVFYNPVQEFNRDLSIAVIREYMQDHFLSLNKKNEGRQDKNCSAVSREAGVSYDDGVTILEALAASGLRSIRYALEIPGVKHVTANDTSSQAVESIKRNIVYNKVEHLVSASEDDAALYMYKHRKFKERFHVIDIDPYGSPSTFLDAAVQSVHDGGLLSVTCTDMAVLCGNGSETCHAKYGAISLKSKCCHEMALRIVLHCIESHANRYGRYIEPLLSLSADFYVRLFVKVFTSPSKVKQTTSKLALVFHCVGCETFTLQPLGKCIGSEKNLKYSPATGPVVGPSCTHCGHRQQLGGPIWNEKLHNFEFVERIVDSLAASPNDFQTQKRIEGTLNVILEELPDVPLYYSMDRLSSTLHSICPKMIQFRSALLNAGYRVSLSHACKTSIKTDAPVEFLWDIMRHWISKNPLKREPSEDSPAKAILAKETSREVSFEMHPDANPDSRKNKLVRFQENPEKYWGPKMRAKTSLSSKSQNDKSVRKQGKRNRSENGSPNGTCDTKQYPCKRFKNGQCDLGNQCKYSHDLVQISSSAEADSPSDPPSDQS